MKLSLDLSNKLEKPLLFKKIIPQEMIDYFNPVNIPNKQFTVYEYGTNPHKPNPYTSRTFSCDFYNFVNDKLYLGQYRQLILKEKEYSPNSILKNYLIGIFKLNNITKKFIIRYSKIPWKYNCHYDCGNNILVQLYNTRRIVLSKKPINNYTYFAKDIDEIDGDIYDLTLFPGDVLIIPAEMSHALESRLNYEHFPLSISATLVLDNIPYSSINFNRNFELREDELRDFNKL